MKIKLLSVCLSVQLLFCLSLLGCKISDDAVAASEQMTASAAGLNSYYAALADSVADTIDLYELDGAISGIPFDAESHKLPEQTRQEIIITKRGKPVARLIPIEQDKERDTFGWMKGTRIILGDVISPSGEIWDAER